MHEQPKNRDWVKNAAIIFLAVLLVLTFFSNTIMNRSLPEVATQDVTSGSIVARVRGTGTVTANTNSQVKMEKTRVIRSVLVKVGQQVEPGDVLFTLGEGSSEEIDAAEENLMNLQNSYNRTAATMPEYNYTTDRRKIDILSNRLSEAEKNLAVAKKAATSATPYADQVSSVEQELEEAIKARDLAKEAYEKERGTLESQSINSIEYYANLGSIANLKTELNTYHDDMVVQELDNFQIAIIRVLVGDSSGSKIDGDLLDDAKYDDRSKIDTQIDRVEALLDGEAYTIIFKNDDDVPLQSSSLSYGAVPTYNYGVPTSSKDTADYTYQFLRWENKETGGNLDIVKEDATYIARYSDTPTPVKTEESNDTTGGTTININTESVNVNVVDGNNNGDGDGDGDGAGAVNAGSLPENVPTTTPSSTLENTETILETETNSSEAIDDTLESASLNSAPQNNIVLSSAMDDITPSIDQTESKENNTDNVPTEKEEEIIPTSPVTGYDRNVLQTWLDLLEEARDLYDEAESYKYYKEQVLNQLKAAYDAAVAEAEKWATALDTYLFYGAAESAVYKSALEAYNTAKDNYDTAVETLNDKISSNQQTIAGYNVDLANTWRQIEKAKEKLADLMGGEEAQILAKTSGVVQTIECAPGDTKQKDDILCTLELPDMGYNLSFSVTNDQAARLRPGDTATVSNFYWGTEITATLNNIKVDPKNPQTNKLLTFDLSGNVTAGSELTLSVGQKSANYDIIIPSSAIRTDANGSFVLKVESKNSPLGNRYIARRIPVEVLASDDSNSAVSADLGFGDYVITTSSAPVKNGELVRLATS